MRPPEDLAGAHTSRVRYRDRVVQMNDAKVRSGAPNRSLDLASAAMEDVVLIIPLLLNIEQSNPAPGPLLTLPSSSLNALSPRLLPRAAR
jgi:hypothetical protein